MPKSMAQWTGFTVTMIVVLGRDSDIFTAIPFGLAAGMLATLLAAAVSLEWKVLRLPLLWPILHQPLTVFGRPWAPSNRKRRDGIS